MVQIRRITNAHGAEIGAILTAFFDAPTTLQQKTIVEAQLIDYAFMRLYPREGINIYRHIEFDTPAITVFRDINNLPAEMIRI